MADAEFKTFADARQAEAEFVKLHKRIDQLTARLKNSGKVSRQSADESGRGWKQFNAVMDRAILKAGGMSIAFNAIRAGVRGAFSEGQRLARQIQEIADTMQEEELKLQIQAGWTPAQVEKQLPSIRKALLTTPSATYAEGIQLQTQLSSSGFNQADIESGAALQTTLDLKAATNQFGRNVGDPKQAVLAISQVVKALGEDIPTAASIRRVGGKLTEAFRISDVQFTDLDALAAKSAGLKALNVDETTQLAAFSSLVDVMGKDMAATAMDQVTIGLRSAAATPKTTKALERIGLKPEDVDLIGETLPEALDKLKKGMSGVDEKTGSLAIIDLFGERASKAAYTMMATNAKTKTFIGLMQGNAFEKNVDTFQNSVFARRQRGTLEREFLQRDEAAVNGGLTWEEVRNLGDLGTKKLMQRTDNPVARLIPLGINFAGRAMTSIFESMGMRPDEAGFYASPMAAAEGMFKRADNWKEKHVAGDVAVKELKRINGNLEKMQDNRPKINRNAHTEK